MLLNQPYQPPAMLYEKKPVLPKETAYVQKAHLIDQKGLPNPQTVKKLIEQTIAAQKERISNQMKQKDMTIQKQQ